MGYYQNEIRGKTGMVLGSMSPWVEAMCLERGAGTVYTIEYQNITVTHPKLRYLSPVEWAEQGTRKYKRFFDFAVTFSFIEHSGLGRYGDALDPMGDLREMDKIFCAVKPGGFLFLGLPTGKDALVWNAHRVYGHLRWPMMAADWIFRGVIKDNSGKMYYPFPATDFDNLAGDVQWLVILQKPTDEMKFDILNYK